MYAAIGDGRAHEEATRRRQIDLHAPGAAGQRAAENTADDVGNADDEDEEDAESAQVQLVGQRLEHHRLPARLRRRDRTHRPPPRSPSSRPPRASPPAPDEGLLACLDEPRACSTPPRIPCVTPLAVFLPRLLMPVADPLGAVPPSRPRMSSRPTSLPPTTSLSSRRREPRFR